MKQLSKNVFSLASADIIGRLLSFFAVAYLARTVGPSSMGILAVGTAILAYGAILADSGLPILGTRSIATSEYDVTSLVKQIWSARLFLSLITLLLGSGILLIAINDTTIRYIAMIYLLSLLPSALILDWLFQGLKSMTTLAIARIVGMAIYLLFVILFVSNSSRITLVPVGWIIGGIGQALFLWTAFRKLGVKTSDGMENLQGIFRTIRQGIPLGVATLISQVVIQFPFIYMGLFETPEITGIYSVAFRVIVLILVVDRVFYTVFFPTISHSFKEGVDILKQKFDRTLKFVSSGALYLGILSVLASRSIFPWIFGTEFRDSSLIFQLLLAYFILTVINSTFTFTLIGIKKERAYTRSLIWGAAGFFAIMLLPVQLPATLMAPLALALFQAISLLIMSKELQTLIPLSLFRRIFFPFVAASLLILLFSNLEKQSPTLSFVLALIISLPVLAFSSGINRDDLDYLKRALI